MGLQVDYASGCMRICINIFFLKIKLKIIRKNKAKKINIKKIIRKNNFAKN